MEQPLDSIPATKPNSSIRYALWIFWAFAALYTAAFVYHVTRCILFPYPLDIVEGEGLARTLQLARGQNPFTLSDLYYRPLPMYPAVFYWVVQFVEGENLSFAFGRSLSTLSVFAICGLLYWLSSSVCQHSKRTTGIVAAVLFISSLSVYQWAPNYSPDLLSLAFGMAAVCVLALKQNTWNVVLSAVLCALAFHTKQPMALFFVVISLTAATRREWSLLTLFVTSFVFTSFAGFLLGGLDYTKMVFLAPLVKEHTSSLGSLVRHLLSVATLYPALIVLSLCGLKLLDGERTFLYDLLWFLFLFTALLLFTCVNPGANVHYYLPLALAGSLLTALTIGKSVFESTAPVVVRRSDSSIFPTIHRSLRAICRKPKLTAWLLVLHMLLQFHLPYHWTSSRFAFPPGGVTPTEADEQAFEELMDNLRDQPELIAATELAFIVLGSGKTYPSPWSLRFYGEEQFYVDMEEGRFNTLVFNPENRHYWMPPLDRWKDSRFHFVSSHENILGRGTIEIWSTTPPTAPIPKDGPEVRPSETN